MSRGPSSSSDDESCSSQTRITCVACIQPPQYNWILAVLATPILETQTKLWLIFNVAYRRYTTLPLGYPTSYAKKKQAEKLAAEQQALVAAEGADGKKSPLDEKHQVKDTRKFPIEHGWLLDMIFNTFKMLGILLGAPGAELSKKQVETLLERGEFKSFPVKLEQAVFVLQEDVTLNALARLFRDLLTRQKDVMKLLGDVVLPTPYVGPMDFAMEADWEDAAILDRWMPKTVYHPSQVPKRNEMGCKLSVSEICFLNVMWRCLQDYMEQVHVSNTGRKRDVGDKEADRILEGRASNLLKRTAAMAGQQGGAKAERKRRKKYVRAKIVFLIRACLGQMRSACEMARFHLPAGMKVGGCYGVVGGWSIFEKG